MIQAPQASAQIPPELLQLLQGGVAPAGPAGPPGPDGGSLPGGPSDQGGPPGMDQLSALLSSIPGQGDQAQGDQQDGGAPDFTAMAPVDLIQHAADMLQAAVAKEKDPVDSKKLTTAVGLIYDVLGGRQKETDAALGTSPAQKLIGRGGY